MFIFNLSVGLLCILISVAFLTLFERKALSYTQLRKGPNKAGEGLLQPFSDALKLLSKEMAWPSSANSTLYSLAPALGLWVALLLWFTLPSCFGSLGFPLMMVFILCCLSISVFPILGAGWSSNSKFSLLGSLRAVAQTISYEVSFAMLLLGLVLLNSSYALLAFFPPFNQWNLFLLLPTGIAWLASAMAETHRTPFDFAEGESELVSGFNTEFSAGPFVMFFLAEYASLMFMSFFFTILFLHPTNYSVANSLKTALLVFLFIWTRATLPRLRYDKLMYLAWKVFLPFSLVNLAFTLGLY